MAWSALDLIVGCVHRHSRGWMFDVGHSSAVIGRANSDKISSAKVKRSGRKRRHTKSMSFEIQQIYIIL